MEISLIKEIENSDLSARTRANVLASAFLSLGVFKDPKGNRSASLKSIFDIQKGLNDLIFEKHNLRTKGGLALTAQEMIDLGREPVISPNSTSAEWLAKFVLALKDEVRELEEEIPWKWWSKDSLDMQNIRVEITDLLFFVVCLAQAAGLDADDLEELYRKKAVVNLERQFKNYSKETKDESDNKGIEVAK